MFGRVLNVPLDYLSCSSVVLRGIHGKVDTYQTDYSIHSKLRISPYLNVIQSARKKQCLYCNSYVQNLRVRCRLNFEFGTYDVIKCIFIFFNVNKVIQHVNYTCLLFRPLRSLLLWRFLLWRFLLNIQGWN